MVAGHLALSGQVVVLCLLYNVHPDANAQEAAACCIWHPSTTAMQYDQSDTIPTSTIPADLKLC